MAERNLDFWREMRFVAKEIGLEQTWQLPVEIRRWWIDQINRDMQQRKDDMDAIDGKKTVPIQ